MQDIELQRLGQRIKSIRKQRKLTLSAVCYKVGIEPSTLSRIENGEVEPKYLTLLKIATSFNMTLSELVKSD